MKFHLVGGPYDGAEGPPFAYFDGVETIYVAYDPQERGPFGLVATKDFRPGFEKYEWFKTESGTDFYVHECLPADMIFQTMRKFDAPPLTPAQMWEQMRREVPDELWDEWFIR